MDLKAIAHQCSQDSATWFPEQFEGAEFNDLVSNFVLCLCGESGEVANVWKKYLRGSISRAEANKKMADELADVFTYLMNFPLLLGFDMEVEYDKKRRFNHLRFSQSRGDAGGSDRSGATSRSIVDVPLPGDGEVPT